MLKVAYNRVPYYFTPENNRIADIQDKNVINYIFSLPNRSEFEVVMPKEPKPIMSSAIDDKPIIRKVGRPKKN